MAGRIYASMPGLEQEAAAINAAVDAKIPEIDACIRAINAYCGDSSLSGAAYQSSKNYYGAVQITILSELKTQMTLLCDANNQLLSNAASAAPLLGEADSAELEREIEELERERDSCFESQYFCENLARTYSSQGLLHADLVISYYHMAAWCNNMAMTADQQITQKREVLEQLIALNDCGDGAYSGILGSIAVLEKLVYEIGASLPGSNDSATKPLGTQALMPDIEHAVPSEIITKLTKLIKDQIVDKDGNVDRAYLNQLMSMEPESVTPIHIIALTSALDSIQLPGNEKGMEDFLECCYPETGRLLHAKIPESGAAVLDYMEYELTPIASGFIGIYVSETQQVLSNSELDLATGDMGDAEIQRINEMVAKSGMLRALLDSGSVMVCEQSSDRSMPLKIDVTRCDAIGSGLDVNENLTGILTQLGAKRPYDYLVTIHAVESMRWDYERVVDYPQSEYKQALVCQMINGRSDMLSNANDASTQATLRVLRPDTSALNLAEDIAINIVKYGLSFVPLVGDVLTCTDGAEAVSMPVAEYMENVKIASQIDQGVAMRNEFIIARNVGLQISTNYYSDGTACVAHTNFPAGNVTLFRDTMEAAPNSRDRSAMEAFDLSEDDINNYIEVLKINTYDRSDEFLLTCGSYFENYSGGVPR